MAHSSASAYRCATILPCKKPRTRFHQSFQVRAQSYRDEGRSSNNIVDGNLRVLRERIEEVKMKERLERCCRDDHHQIAGWNYASFETSYKSRRETDFVEFVQLLSMVSATFGLTILSCSFLVCIFSLLAHLNP